jgi:LDH2 family malate/lactate/ureidoglycolate dehydrogenase
MPDIADTIVSHVVLQRQVEAILASWGMHPGDAAEIASLLVETDLRGIASHGASILPMYDGMRQAGTLLMRPEVRVVRETPVLAVLDGGAGLGHLVARQAMDMAVAKSRDAGIGAVSVFNSHHFGAAGLYAEIAAKAGMLGLVTASARTQAVLPTGGTAPLLGTNPLAFAAPAGRHRPFLLDMATSTVAVNKIKVYAYGAKQLPPGWVVDDAGQVVTDPVLGLQWCQDAGGGGLLPLGGLTETGGHKGYGLGLMAQILGSTLAGGSFSPLRDGRPGPPGPDNIGHFVLAIRPDMFRMEGSFERDMEDMIDALHASAPIDAKRPVLVAGEPEYATKARRLVEGIPIAAVLLRQLQQIAADSGAPFLLGSDT